MVYKSSFNNSRCLQAARPDTVVFAVVRNSRTSAHLNLAVKGLKNVHVLDADVLDHASLEVSQICSFSARPYKKPLNIPPQRAAKQVAEITSGSLDVLIHNVARLDPVLDYARSGFDDL